MQLDALDILVKDTLPDVIKVAKRGLDEYLSATYSPYYFNDRF